MKSQLIPTNTLTQTGVIHEVTDILIPRSVEITVGNLVKAAKASTMMNMVNRAGFDWILNGTSPPEGSEWSDIFGSISGVGWTLLCPSDEAFKHENLTELFADTEKLKRIVMQHLVPSPFPNFRNPDGRNFGHLDNTGGGDDGDKPGRKPGGDTGDDAIFNNQPLVLEDSATYSTLRTTESIYGDIVFRSTGNSDDGEKQFIVGIKNARGTNGKDDWANVVSWGRATKSGVSTAPSIPPPFTNDDDQLPLVSTTFLVAGLASGGVIQIDRLLSPYEPSWWIAYGGPTFVGGFGIVAICAFFYGVSVVWGWDTREATYEPVGGFGREDDEE
jgi:solute carrier family 25 carnitine/acylcarnitine transporter 20/29